MKRGDVVVVALTGDLGKPRPAVIVETDRLAATGHVLLCPGTSHLIEAPNRRVLVEPSPGNGLREPTQFQVDKVTPARRDKCGQAIGALEEVRMTEISTRLMIVLGLAD